MTDSGAVRKTTVSWGVSSELRTVTPAKPQTGSHHYKIPDFLDLGQLIVSAESTLSHPRDDIPDRVEASYTDDFNILNVHHLILKRFDALKQDQIAKLQHQRDDQRARMLKPHNMVEHKQLLNETERVTNELNSITSGHDKAEYLSKVKDLIAVYQEIGTNTKLVAFNTSKKESPKAGENHQLRHQVIARYLEIARHYISIDVIREVPFDTKCPSCDQDFKDVAVDDNGIQRCPNGCFEKQNLIQAAHYKDSSRVNLSTRNGYDNRDNFYKAMMRHQGKQQNRLPEKMFDLLDNYFIAFGLPTSAEVKKMSLTERDRRGLNQQLLYKAMADRGFPSYYDDGNLIANLYWGVPLPEYSHLEDIIMDDYDGTQKIFEELPKDERTSCLNTQYRLFQHLRARGYPCKIDDFKMINSESREAHDKLWKPMIEGIGLVFYPTI